MPEDSVMFLKAKIAYEEGKAPENYTHNLDKITTTNVQLSLYPPADKDDDGNISKFNYIHHPDNSTMGDYVAYGMHFQGIGTIPKTGSKSIVIQGAKKQPFPIIGSN